MKTVIIKPWQVFQLLLEKGWEMSDAHAQLDKIFEPSVIYFGYANYEYTLNEGE